MNRTALVAVALGTLLFSGCAVVPHFGLFYTDAKHPGSLDAVQKDLFLAGREYQILSRVSGESVVENYAGVYAAGDYSVEAAYKDALAKAKGADALIDVHVDQHTFRIFTFYIQATTIVTGTAIRMGGAAPAATPAAGPGTPAGAAPAGAATEPGKPAQPGEKKPEDDFGWGK
jgi:hypothetical protein